jgi:outer membrane receptor protein involved in Fe transport
MKFLLVFISTITVLSGGFLYAQDDEEQPIVTTEHVQVTASRIPEAVEPEPASITIVSGEELIATGANDLPSALSLVAGVSIAPGGDGGPASSVPELWGLREFDAFLLVVDNVPWGGAFNPDLASLDLNSIDRIEILRGAAPVMYGATSFVGVIHVIHLAPGTHGYNVRAYGGNFSTGGASARAGLPSSDTWHHWLAANFDSVGYRDDRTGYNRGHFLYRATSKIGEGLFHFDTDLTFLTQDPASPHPRSGAVLTPLVPLDANHNPSDHEQDENRFHFVGGYDRHVMGGDWSVIAAYTHTDRDIIKGFLTDISESVELNAAGFRQDQNQSDFYLDTHFLMKPRNTLRFVFGADYLFGKGKADSENFDYFVNLNGSNAPSSTSALIQERPRLEDERNFLGFYGQMDWNPTSRFLIQTGLRLNNTHEKMEGEVEPGDPGGEVEEEEEGGEDSQSHTRLSGIIGASYMFYASEENNLWVFGDYRNTFKPAVVDFGPEAEGEILEPETAQSYEAGVKGDTFNGLLDWQVSFFRMDFKNLVTPTVVNGLPALINAGETRFTGVELEGDVRVYTDLRLKLGYSHHNAKFRNFIQAFDGVPTQLSGKRFEMSPEDLFSAGVIYFPKSGINGSFVLNYVGDRFLNKRNTALAEPFTTIALGAGYRFGHNNIRFDIENISDERDPVAESELGDAQYYRQPARNFRISWNTDF